MCQSNAIIICWRCLPQFLASHSGIRGVASPGHSWDGWNLLLRPDSSDGIPEVLGSEGIWLSAKLPDDPRRRVDPGNGEKHHLRLVFRTRLHLDQEESVTVWLQGHCLSHSLRVKSLKDWSWSLGKVSAIQSRATQKLLYISKCKNYFFTSTILQKSVIFYYAQKLTVEKTTKESTTEK